MALSTYANLKQSVINWSHRDDLDLLIDDFIEIAETEMFANEVETLNIRAMETQSVISLSTNTNALPSGYLSLRSARLQVSNGNGTLIFKSPESLNRLSGTGRPKYYTIHNQIEVDVSPDQTYNLELNYIKKPDALTSSNVTNEILDNYPNIYLYGCLWAAFTYADDEAQAQKYYSRFISNIKGANMSSDQGQFGALPSIRIDGATP
jgi:hypothetical protein